jgi:hypothetical protein
MVDSLSSREQNSVIGLIFRVFLTQPLSMAPRFVNCKGCSRHFNTNVEKDFTCCLCKAIDACTSDIERDVLKACVFW